ncbi:hypothetical protein SK3146_04973 [Paenibacillus konkukensis]|uniref:Renal dipeptidase n=1 Tax=Paenibacillus konkukensis TaxID=2020716 RepID=A0ABY4RVA4_9BACL|nr:hypothetical protein SK3146_04973 [Paenibacillus konkukensis]
MSTDFRLDTASFPEELNLMLALLGGEAGDKLQAAGIDWDLFLQLARHHRVYPSLYHKLQQAGISAIPAHVMQALRADYQQNIFRMLQLSGEMEQICRTLGEANIRTLVLKGPVLAADLYGDLSLRTCGDLDLLVPIDDLDRAEQLLGLLGYIKDEYIQTVLSDWKWRHHHITFFHRHMGIKIELHWRLGPGPGSEPGFYSLWQRKRLSAITRHPVYYLGREDLFLFLVSHGARHGWSRLRWLTDIHQLCRQPLDDNKLRGLLVKYRTSHIAAQAWILTSQLLHTPLSESCRRWSKEQRARSLAQGALYYIGQMINLHSEPLPEDVSRYHKRHLFALMSCQTKLLFIMSLLYPYPHDAETLALPKALHFLYFPLRPFLWAWRKTKKVRLIVARSGIK